VAISLQTVSTYPRFSAQPRPYVTVLRLSMCWSGKCYVGPGPMNLTLAAVFMLSTVIPPVFAQLPADLQPQFDEAEGRIVGLEILDASRRTGDPSVLKQFSFDLPPAA